MTNSKFTVYQWFHPTPIANLPTQDLTRIQQILGQDEWRKLLGQEGWKFDPFLKTAIIPMVRPLYALYRDGSVCHTYFNGDEFRSCLKPSALKTDGLIAWREVE